MPQMAPMMWLYLFMFFSMFFMFNLILNYFIKSPEKLSFSTSPSSKNLMSIKWKW
nr:ATP synthase F0 subunit 8 [Exhippolysmata ensirostris]